MELDIKYSLNVSRFPGAGEVHILNAARKLGVRESQIVFSDVAPRDEHLRRGVLADLFLDTATCNAHTTACDILFVLLLCFNDKLLPLIYLIWALGGQALPW